MAEIAIATPADIIGGGLKPTRPGLSNAAIYPHGVLRRHHEIGLRGMLKTN